MVRNCVFFSAFVSNYMTTIQFIVSTDQRKYSRTYKHDVTLYDVGGNGVPFINCNVTVTTHC